MSIVEKGIWDDLFPLEGGGHVHMKLQFILNEDERNRIRGMVPYIYIYITFLFFHLFHAHIENHT